MIIFFALGLILGALTVMFALQNMDVVTVSFLPWELEGSMALILLLAAGSGLIVALLFTLPESISNYFQVRRLRKENQRLSQELVNEKNQNLKTMPTQEEIHIKETSTITRG